MDSLVKLFYEEVDIETSPVATIADAVGIGTILGVVGNLHASHRIRIEIVVDMEAIDIVARHDIPDHLADVIAALLQGRIEQRQTIVLESPFGMLHNHVITGIAVSNLRLGTIGIDPRMKLHTAFVALRYHPLQRVPIRIRLRALFACQIVAPRFELTLVQGVALGTHLEDNGITTILLEFIQLVSQRALHGLGGHSLELSIDTLYPRSAEFSLLLG